MSPLDFPPDSDSIRFWFRLGLSVRSLIYMEKKSVGMYVVWLSPSGRGGFTGISREYVLTFLHLRQPCAYIDKWLDCEDLSFFLFPLCFLLVVWYRPSSLGS